MLETLDGIDDPRLAPYRDLKRSNLTRWSRRFIVEGEKVVERLLASSLRVESIVVGESWVDRIAPQVAPATPLWVLPDRAIPDLAGFQFHRGVLACAVRPDAPSLDTLFPVQAQRLLIVACPELHDPENLGGVIRTSAALGVDALLVGRGSADPFSRRVVRVSMGNVFSIPLRESSDLAADVEWLTRERGVEWWGTVLDPTAERLPETVRKPKTGIVLGSEGQGLSAAWVERCQRRVSLPMERGTDSLNVATAAGIFLYHLEWKSGESK